MTASTTNLAHSHADFGVSRSVGFVKRILNQLTERAEAAVDRSRLAALPLRYLDDVGMTVGERAGDPWLRRAGARPLGAGRDPAALKSSRLRPMQVLASTSGTSLAPRACSLRDIDARGQALVARALSARAHMRDFTRECASRCCACRLGLTGAAQHRKRRLPSRGRPDATRHADRQLRQLHLQPRPLPRRTGGGGVGLAQRRDHGRGRARLEAGRNRAFAWTLHPERSGRVPRPRPLGQRNDADARRLSRAIRRSGRRSAATSCARRRRCTARSRASRTTRAGSFAA